eukprot:1932223-Pyramimonas_sp.AAC.3
MVLMDHTSAHSVAQRLTTQLSTLDRVASERMMLEDRLKEAKNADNILPQMMTSLDHEALFVQELQKYDPLKQEAAQLKVQQAQVLKSVAATHADFIQAFQAQQAQLLESVTATHAVFMQAFQGLKGWLNQEAKSQEILFSPPAPTPLPLSLTEVGYWRTLPNTIAETNLLRAPGALEPSMIEVLPFEKKRILMYPPR